MLSPKFSAVALIALCALAWSLCASAQNALQNPLQKSGKYVVELRIPAEGVFAEEEIDIELRLTDSSQEDPVQGAPPIVKANIAALLSMPLMPSMPKQKPKTHSEGVPGDYGVIVYAPHGGDYLLQLTITPPNEKPFTVNFKLSVLDATDAKKRKPKPKPFLLEMESKPAKPVAGQPAELTLALRSRATKQIVTDYDVVHEQLMHLIIVSKDLRQFAHEHPALGEGGKFTLRYTFPSGGTYHLFTDVAPKGAGSQVLMQPLQVEGDAPPKFALNDKDALPVVGGVRLAFQNDKGALMARRALNLQFEMKDEASGKPITDLQPWLGAMAHLILIHEDGTTFVHSHPDETDPQNGKNGSLSFLARLPKPGLYRGWVQFQRDNAVHTAPFGVRAKEISRL